MFLFQVGNENYKRRNCWSQINYLCSLQKFFSGCLLDSDITALAKDKAYSQIRLDEMSIHQVLGKCCLCMQTACMVKSK